MSLNSTDFISSIQDDGDVRTKLIVSQTVPFAFAVLAAVLRLGIRRLSKTGLRWDDWLILPALAGATVFYGIFWWWVSWGLGAYVGDATPSKLHVAYLSTWISELAYNISFSLAYFSVLLLCSRVARKRLARWCCALLATCRFLFTVSIIVIMCLECQPLNGVWDWNVPAHCDINLPTLYLAGSATHTGLVVALMVLALYILRTLKLSQFDRILMLVPLATGLLVIALSCVRLAIRLKLFLEPKAPLNITWTPVPYGMWTGVELFVGMITACLPCVRLPARRATIDSSRSSLQKPQSPGHCDTPPMRIRHVAEMMKEGPIPVETSPTPESRSFSSSTREGGSAGSREDVESARPRFSEELWLQREPTPVAEVSAESESESESESMQLPLHNMEGDDTRLQHTARIDRPPSWPLGVTAPMMPVSPLSPTGPSDFDRWPVDAMTRSPSEETGPGDVVTGGPGWI